MAIPPDAWASPRLGARNAYGDTAGIRDMVAAVVRHLPGPGGDVSRRKPVPPEQAAAGHWPSLHRRHTGDVQAR
jgi:hypothetical protein